MNLLHTAHVPPGDGPFATILALHGWGASAHDLLGLAPVFPDATQFLCPQGKVRLPVGPGAFGYGWFPLERGTPPDPRAFLTASTELRDFTDAVMQRYATDPGRTVPLGFSQGGLMAYDLALRQPGRFAGLVALSTWLPEILASKLPRLPEQEGFPVLVIHGSEDVQVEVEKARESKAVLEGLGVDLSYEEFPMGHEIRPEAMRRILQWWSEKISS